MSSELEDKAKVESYKLYLVTKKMFDGQREGNKDETKTHDLVSWLQDRNTSTLLHH